jgi:PAS domain S-box-containing protein
VEDLPSDVELAERELHKNGLAFTGTCVDNAEGLEKALRNLNPNIVISDYSMPAFDGMSALRIVKEFNPETPFLVLTGSMNEEIAVECMKAGACDYVIKEHLSRLPYAIQVALERQQIATEYRLQEELLHQSEERYRSIFEDSAAVMLMIDPGKSTVLDANKAASEFYGWTHDELIGKKMSEINTLRPEMHRELVRRALSRERMHFQFKHHMADGTIKDVETHSGPIRIADKEYLFSVIHDISDRLAAERDRDRMAQRLSYYLQMSPTITYSMRLVGGEARIEWVSENIKSILGFSVEEVQEPEWWFKQVFQADRESSLKGIPTLINLGSHSHEYRFLKKDHAVVWLRDSMRLLKGNSGSAEIIGTLTDISSGKSDEEKIKLQSAALEALETAVVITDRDGTIEWANCAFETLTGYPLPEAAGRNPRELVKSNVQDPSVYRQLWDTIRSGKSWHGEIINKKKSGQLYNEEITITPVMDSDKKIQHFIAIKNDISQRVLSNEKLKASLLEKEVLLREIHHRVKNNMQIVSSLLSLSLDDNEDPSFLNLINELHRRIDAMSLVHEQFYTTTDVSRIDFSMFLRQIINNIMEEYRIPPGRIEVTIHAEVLMLELDSAIPAGLIVSELISNALKAMTGSNAARNILQVSFKQAESGQASIEIRDNGPGLPRGFDPGTTKTLGMRLIEILSEQLHGSVTFSSADGTSATLGFPLAMK